ncbi:hypothetical protein ABH975_004196 [Bradyrhizobium ottawaense]
MNAKKRPAEAGPLFPYVLADAEINNPSLLRLQASRLVRIYAVNAAMAETIAPLVFLEVMR